jgi:hypothetical protein
MPVDVTRHIRLPSAEETALRSALSSVCDLARDIDSGRVVIFATSGHHTTATHRETLPLVSLPGRYEAQLKVLDTVTKRLQAIVGDDHQLADALRPLADELFGLRTDLAEIFSEIKTVNKKVTEDQAHLVAETKKTQDRTDIRLDELEKPHAS